MSVRLLGLSLLLIAISVFKIPAVVTGQQAAANPPANPRWEYKVIKVDSGQCSSEQWLAGALNSLGKDGWELVGHQQVTPLVPSDAQGTLLIRPAATGPNSSVEPKTADSFQGTITMKMGQVHPASCLLILKRQLSADQR